MPVSHVEIQRPNWEQLCCATKCNALETMSIQSNLKVIIICSCCSSCSVAQTTEKTPLFVSQNKVDFYVYFLTTTSVFNKHTTVLEMSEKLLPVAATVCSTVPTTQGVSDQCCIT